MTLINKRTIILERTVTERVTVQFNANANDNANAVTVWANYGLSGASPLDLLPDQFPHRSKQVSDWTVMASDPPLLETAQRHRIATRKKT